MGEWQGCSGTSAVYCFHGAEKVMCENVVSCLVFKIHYKFCNNYGFELVNCEIGA